MRCTPPLLAPRHRHSPTEDVKSDATTESSLSEVPVHGCQKERQTPEPLANAVGLSMHRMPAPFHRRPRLAQDLSAQNHPRRYFHVQPRLLTHRDATTPTKALPPPDPGTHHQLVARRVPSPRNLLASPPSM